MKAMKVVLTVAVLAAIAVAAFVTLRPRHEPGEVIVFCGGSMRVALEEIIKRYNETFEGKVMGSYGGSGELFEQLRNTPKGDLYLCHDPFMPLGAKEGLIDKWTTVAHLDVAIIVPKGNPKGIKELKDLARPGLRLGIGNQTYSTSGQVVKHMFARQPYGKDIMKNVRVETKGHQARCNDVAMGTLDVSIVWNAVAHLFRDKLEIIPIPKDYVDAITTATFGECDLKNIGVTIGITKYGKGKPRVERFYEFATTKGLEVFKENGFSPVEK
jgi:molybdate transport system substrate-binding protein